MATQINNTASLVYSYGTSGQDSAQSNISTTNLISEYAISGNKSSHNSTFRPGENLTYLIQISNDGISPLYNVTVTDNYGGTGSYITFLTGSAKLNLNGTVTNITPTSTNPLTFVLQSPLDAGDLATITFVVKVSPSIPSFVTIITNTATIQANEGSATGQIITVMPTPTITIPLENYANVSMTKSVSSEEISVGEPYSYSLTLTNIGNLPAQNIVVTDTLPPNFSITSITSLTDGILTTFSSTDYTVDASTNTLTLPNETSTLSISVPAATLTENGLTLITITGLITA